MEIKHRDNHTNGKFYVENESRELAYITYNRDGNTLSVDHTHVDDELRGKSAGKQLVAEAVKYARNNGLKIRPVCTFVKSVFDKTEDFSDVRQID